MTTPKVAGNDAIGAIGATCVTPADYARLCRALRTLSAGNRALARAPDEQTLLQDMCNAIVEQGGYRMAWIGYIEHDEHQTIRPMAHAGVEDGFLQLLDLTWSEQSTTPSGLAIRTGQPQVGHDVLNDPALAILFEEQKRRGYAAASAYPLVIDGEIGGNLSIVAGEYNAFGEEELRVLSELAEDVAYGISALRSRVRHQEAEAAMHRMAYYDQLTGLPNRTLFLEQLGRMIASSSPPFRPFAVGILSVTQFREINDVLGYQQANELLLQVAARLQPQIDQGYFLGRVSDNEFAILQPNTDAERTSQEALRLLRQFDEPLSVAGIQVDARLRIGLSLFPGHGQEPDALMRRATMASRQALHSAVNYTIFNGSLDKECTRHVSLIAELHHAIEHDELRLYCQPKIQFDTGKLCGAEALVRWQHPERGLVEPDLFIKLAEQAGMITSLTHWILEAAFRHIYTLEQAGRPTPLAVNLSARDLLDPRLAERIRGLFLTWGIDPAHLQFELTESALMDDPGGALATLNQLKALGVQLAVDDFGTGYSSLSYLQRLPADTIKIDQSFVGAMIADQESDTIVRSTIDLGHNLGLHVVAEGVENRDIWNRLATLGCDIAQGYFVSRPIPVEQFDSSWHTTLAA
ncbi:diguanylate cyclase/phosphodiesterase [Pseudogulbenkiania sp. NH8B]|uniref:putative bifunctional diguanylate cyclase/phosphodiesterase n=1 Tax=Pseudogulbenkiania sp. (strain NH8B) TaxID=748280 RepID=UPI0002279903|nr:GGDEF domain-containing protein [Pseudogulbenkiania sp. NH8B]BAK77301.1 diguanylate cyclase/phosphodiesterase [Pseudogulbenkiania sp. NH8B]